jgi:hypothetical protein
MVVNPAVAGYENVCGLLYRPMGLARPVMYCCVYFALEIGRENTSCSTQAIVLLET